MPTRLPSLRPPIGFAHRGARAHAPENTIDAFSLARKLGADGLESDVWRSADGVAVLDHDGFAGGRLRRRSIASVTHTELPSHIPTLAELYDECGTGFELSLDVKDPAAAPLVISVARAAGPAALGRLWLCHDDHDLLRSWRDLAPEVRLVDSTRLRRMRQGPERHAAALQAAGIDAVNLHHSDWTGGLTTLFHRFEILAFGWDAQYDRVLDGLLDMGIDAVYSDHVDRMVDALARAAAT
jgi:glycerophosphoryl diester phosphodiesterase